jgi:hypothetical protein
VCGKERRGCEGWRIREARRRAVVVLGPDGCATLRNTGVLDVSHDGRRRQRAASPPHLAWSGPPTTAPLRIVRAPAPHGTTSMPSRGRPLTVSHARRPQMERSRCRGCAQTRRSAGPSRSNRRLAHAYPPIPRYTDSIPAASTGAPKAGRTRNSTKSTAAGRTAQRCTASPAPGGAGGRRAMRGAAQQVVDACM